MSSNNCFDRDIVISSNRCCLFCVQILWLWNFVHSSLSNSIRWLCSCFSLFSKDYHFYILVFITRCFLTIRCMHIYCWCHSVCCLYCDLLVWLVSRLFVEWFAGNNNNECVYTSCCNKWISFSGVGHAVLILFKDSLLLISYSTFSFEIYGFVIHRARSYSIHGKGEPKGDQTTTPFFAYRLIVCVIGNSLNTVCFQLWQIFV